MKRFTIIAVAVTGFLLCGIVVVGCVSAEEYAAAQASLADNKAKMEQLEAARADLMQKLEDEMNSEDPSSPEKVAMLIEEVAEIVGASDDARAAFESALATVKKADSGWDFAQMAIGAASVFVPGLAGGGAVVGNLRKRYEGTVGDFNGLIASIAAGGGPKDSQAARDAMAHYPGLKQRVTNRRVEIGDKELKAVKVEG